MTDFQMIPTGLVLVDDAYQRVLDQRWVDRHVSVFDSRLLGTLTVTPQNGHYTVIDGQHRLRLAQAVGMTHVPCVVVDTDSHADAARVFVSVNRERRAVSPIDMYHADLLAGNVTAHAIKEVSERHGYSFAGANLDNRGVITTILGVRRGVALYGPSIFEFALSTITSAWGHDSPNARRQAILLGLFSVALVHGDSVNAVDFGKRVGRKSALYFLQEYSARTSRSAVNSANRAVDATMGELLVEAYNSGLRKNKLPELEIRLRISSIAGSSWRQPWEERETRCRAEAAS